MKNKLVILYVFLLVLIAFVLFLCNVKSNQLGCGVDDRDVFICGTPNISYSVEGKKGKQLFNMNCAACHKLDKHMTGPKLRNILSKYKSKNIKIEDFLIGKRERLLYQEDFDAVCPVLNLNEGEINNLVVYLNKISE